LRHIKAGHRWSAVRDFSKNPSRRQAGQSRFFKPRAPHERRLAAETAWAEPGVTDVENDIVVVA
jgi:hypothetical protein